MSGAPGLELIEALIWRTGTRDRAAVARILRAVRDYARGVGERAERLPAERASMLVMDPSGQLHSATLGELLDPGSDGSDWWPR